ncbi:hypothetical protein MPTK1_4g12550 [Marchantia polymorpha subsp. ruderalis]|uniref:Uncharacterized protein n=2 Tax=Marchantia polymorpha TaxID=3197 RepID=A0AAF6B980_MARPO|nr:hypothetical protein MARPO_0174s0017 [Marchantia polymorpha]BBN08564.1 hypothetical protein Mp_4g12550 [Marchantia polymorpha subsp. ruderalis]|eukprot:PTQ28090.1 hypothetical protein MARPO_0174s0017 [Marchantia polymorpha]
MRDTNLIPWVPLLFSPTSYLTRDHQEVPKCIKYRLQSVDDAAKIKWIHFANPACRW